MANTKIKETERDQKERGNVFLAIVSIAAILLFAGYKYGIFNSFQTNSAAEIQSDDAAEYVAVDFEALETDDTLQNILADAKEQFVLVKNATEEDRIAVANAADVRLLELMTQAATIESSDYATSVYNYVSCVDAYAVNTFNTQYDAEKYTNEADIALSNAESNFESLVDIRVEYLREAGLSDSDLISRLSR